ncbi:epoxyqueuosine reductase [Gracilinema caldarium]|uniref:Iron-sulfur protein n=1 Tax=Gracilinema caldarium (strain ATCC 51460 / DSM 7334 / H1) TaxID=744872 RepID=F8F4E0_GRAC1|nr:4Fe-4S double cluster binding domain-containing protein [Gracilinema caldarium]AEJ20587.1 putative iron-sulfur protein [Gracilinema caldarium DSM 7334]
MDPASIADYIRTEAYDKGFSRVRFLSPYNPGTIFNRLDGTDNHWKGAPSLLVVALPYGNSGIAGALGQPSTIAPFARRNYYAEAVTRLKDVAKNVRARFGGQRSDYRILCNSPVPEKPLALLCGLGWLGKNSLIITPEAGSLVIIAAMTLPFQLPGDSPLSGVFLGARALAFPACKVCGDSPACMNACPTKALSGDGTVQTDRCIQWYASGNGTTVPNFVADVWENQLYGCTYCQDACPYNKKKIKGSDTERGKLPEFFTAEWVLSSSDESIRKAVQGSALGMQWLGPVSLRRNASLVLRRKSSV